MPVRASVSPIIGFACCLTVPFTSIGARAEQRNAAIVVDGGWSGDYAKKACKKAESLIDDDTMSRIRNFGCGAVAGCPERMAHLAACTTGAGPKILAHQFEDRLLTQFAISSGCKGAAFARYDGPNGKQPSAAEEEVMRRPHWELSIDFRAGSATQSWSLQYLGDAHVFQGESATEAKMASEICTIVFGQRGIPAR
jgi:hypothetical protein